MAVFVLLAVVVMAPGPASAHARIVASEPAEGARLDDSPEQLRIWLSETVSASYSSVELQTLDGRVIPITGLTVTTEGSEGLLTADLPVLDDGTYSAQWTVLSDSDGHITRGLVVFGVGPGAVTAVASDAAREDVPAAESIAKWASLLALLWIVGALLMIGPIVSTGVAGDTPVLRRWLLAVALLGCVSGVMLLLVQASVAASNLPGGPRLLGVARGVLIDTVWGRALLVRLLLFAAIAVGASTIGRGLPVAAGRRGLLLRAVVIGGLVIAQAVSSHATGVVDDRIVAVLADALHVAAASIWLGGLMSLLVVRRHLARSAWTRFGRLAALSVGVLVATGLFATGLQVRSIDAALDTTYGWSLATKLGLVAIVGALGLANATSVHDGLSRLVRDRRRRTVGGPGFVRTVRWELTAGIAVVAATALLTSLSPANRPELGSAEIVNSRSAVVDDILVTLVAQPNRPGDNVLVVHTASRTRPAPAIDRVLVRFGQADDGSNRRTEQMERVEPDRFRLGGSQLGRAGTWDLQVVIRRTGLADAVADFEWVVPLRPPEPTRISTTPLRGPLSMAAALLLVLVAVLGLTALVRLRGRDPRTPRVPVGPPSDSELVPTPDAPVVSTERLPEEINA